MQGCNMYPILKMVSKKNFLPSYLLDDDDVRDELFSALLSLLRAQQVSVFQLRALFGRAQCNAPVSQWWWWWYYYVYMYVVVRL